MQFGRRDREGRTAERIAESLGYTESALAATYDDGNAAFEDVHEEDDATYNRRCRQDDTESYCPSSIPSIEAAAVAQTLIRDRMANKETFTFQFLWSRWAKHWRTRIKQSRQRCRAITTMELNGRSIPEHPGQFFIADDLQCFLALHHSTKFNYNGWITLPGPPTWWNFDFEKLGIDGDGRDTIQARKRALRMIYAKKMPRNFFTFEVSVVSILALRRKPDFFRDSFIFSGLSQ
ncbi:uncharacterized protein KD926_006137 [Aspergillus affinis]|uniref:uncharacterized protein n=1 Tax=Aspergillus affinis TaxID=1070780 RepID=UPI0022FDEAA8|nr:uncharacterized protein KD926_006137 [Aspergillus affinis]KAI9042013.1 hypothetical protein KD926_006137 [Aspergillus affinis]